MLQYNVNAIEVHSKFTPTVLFDIVQHYSIGRYCPFCYFVSTAV